ncbi:MAG: exosortase C-terminal domain/associated protein EpsI [Verrucomicrobiota bacterium]
MTGKLISLQAFLLLGLGAVFFLPKSSRIKEAALIYLAPLGADKELEVLPPFVGLWMGTKEEASEKEKAILAEDTKFDRRAFRSDGRELNGSIVLSGYDLNNSIHRPERCLPAQGHTLLSSSTVSVDLPNGEALPVTRLFTDKIVETKDGQKVPVGKSIMYYWFVGNNTVTNSHYERTLADMKERLLAGANQRWAYVTVSSNLHSEYYPNGGNEEETDDMLREFISRLAPEIIDYKMVKN